MRGIRRADGAGGRVDHARQVLEPEIALPVVGRHPSPARARGRQSCWRDRAPARGPARSGRSCRWCRRPPCSASARRRGACAPCSRRRCGRRHRPCRWRRWCRRRSSAVHCRAATCPGASSPSRLRKKPGSTGPWRVRRRSTLRTPAPFTAIAIGSTANGRQPSGVMYSLGLSGLIFSTNRSCTSGPVLVKPQASVSLRPSTTSGSPAAWRRRH